LEAPFDIKLKGDEESRKNPKKISTTKPTINRK